MDSEEKDEDLGMINPFHLADLEDQKNGKNIKNWTEFTSIEELERELKDSLKSKYPNIDEINLFDPKDKSPLYPWTKEEG